MPFRERWIIEGTLTNDSPLHVGDGGTTKRSDSPPYENLWRTEDLVRKTVAIASVVQGVHGPVIPGSTLKGNLRAWLEKHAPKADQARVRLLFGFQEHGEDIGQGGLVEFHDAPSAAPETGFNPGRFWCSDRRTCVATSVAIHRGRRSASDEKLIHTEFVPTGIGFTVTIAGVMEKPDVELLLWALAAFNAQDAITVGANDGNGWGRMNWHPTGVRRISREYVAANAVPWLNGATTMPVAYAAGQQQDLDALLMSARQRGAVAATETLHIKINLTFDHGFLVNDTSRTGKGEHRPDHYPLRVTPDGAALLPASSIRGALRAQAERILRTIMDDGRAAWAPDQPQAGAPAFADSDNFAADMKRLCPVSRLFGGPGWKAPLRISDFTGPVTGDLPKQHFVAIDRFTGGGGDRLKFNADYVPNAKLAGHIDVDLKKLRAGAGGEWPLALLAFVLRDLAEGDISLGFGSAKGFGSCRAKIDPAPAPDGKTLTSWFEELKSQTTDYLANLGGQV